MSQARIIDMWAPIVPIPEVLEYAASNFPKEMLGYLRVFFKQEPEPATLPELFPKFAQDEETVLASLKSAGIRRTLITGFDERTSVGKAFMDNEVIAKLADRHPEQFLPFAGVDVQQGMTAVRALEYWVKGRGFRGLSLRPFMNKLHADDRRYYPFYAKCVELDIPVSIHASANWSTMCVNDFGHPRHFDIVATDFPELKLILSHAGYPWVLEACLLAWKHPNLYLELAAHRPKYFAVAGTGWEPLLRYGQTTIQDKILFGTGSFLQGRAPGELVEEFRALPIKADVLEKWLYRNAQSVLNLKEEALASA